MVKKDPFQEGKKLMIQGDRQGGIKKFTEAINAGVHTGISFLSRGVAHLHLKDYDSAIHDFSRSIEIDRNNPRAWYYRGTANMARNGLEDAIYDFTRTIELEPMHGLAYLGRGTCYEDLGRREEAGEDIRMALICTQTSSQKFVDSMGLVRTQADRAFHLTIGEARDPVLTEEEAAQLKMFIEQEWSE